MTVKLLATGLDFLQPGVSGTALRIESIMENPEISLHILAYVISDDAEKFLELLESAIITKVSTILVINDLQHQDKEVIKKLELWDKGNKNFKLVDFNRKKEIQIKSKFAGTCSKCGISWNLNELIFLQQKNSHENIPKLICKDEKCFVSNGGNMFPRKMLHAKVIVVDRKKAVLGSANLSWGGMASHYEVGVYLEDNEHDNESEILATMIESVANSVEN